jgi:hypothetical protein
MNHWQEQFAQQMDALCAQSSSWFDRFSDDVIVPSLETLTGFLDRWHYEITTPACDEARRTFRFALTEDGYLLVWFRMEGFDTLECEYEYSLPGVGRVKGVRTTGSLRAADADWVESCFQMALNAFVVKFLELGNRKHMAEPILA